MRWIMAGAAVAGLIALGACEDGAPEQNVVQVKPRNEYVERLQGMSEANRGLVLRRAILDTPGDACKRVDYSGYQEDYGNLSMWIVRCSDGHDWGVFIAPTSDVQVRSCADHKTLKLPECRFPAGAVAKP